MLDAHVGGGGARAWEVVLQSIESDMLTGKLGPGDHLQPERALATNLGVGRSSVREAIRVLEVLGLIRTQTGSGPQSGAIIIARPSGGMSALMRLQVAAQGFVASDVVKTRVVLESAIVERLAEISPDAQLSAAIETLAAMDSGDLDRSEFLVLDAQFHLCLAEATGNEVISAMMAGLRSAVESYVIQAAPFLPSWPNTSRRLQSEHREIVAAVQSGDSQLARELVTRHITGYYEETSGAALEGPSRNTSQPAQ